MARVAVAAPSMLRSCAATHLSSAPTKPTANPKAAKFAIFLEPTLMRTKGGPVNARCAKASPPAAPNFRNLENSVNVNKGISINIPCIVVERVIVIVHYESIVTLLLPESGH